MVRVCMIAYTHYATDPRVRREAEMLAARGDQVDVICLGSGNTVRPANTETNGVRLYPLRSGRYRGSHPLVYLIQYLLFFVAASFRLTTLHLRHRYHVIQVHTMPDFMVFTALVPKLLGAKVILDVHDLMPELYQSKFGVSTSHWLIRLLTWVERRSIAFAHAAIAVHTPHLQALVNHGNPRKKFLVLLNLPDPSIFKRSVKAEVPCDGRFRMIYHGTLAARHGLRVALEALSLVSKNFDNIELLILGDGDDLPYLLNLTEQLQLTDRVTFSKKFVPISQIVPIILGADVGIVPILNDEFTQYMLPTKLLEYFALGIPVIASRTETICAHFDESMICYAKAEDARDLAQQIESVYSRPPYREQLAQAATAWDLADKWQAQKQQYYDLVNALAGVA